MKKTGWFFRESPRRAKKLTGLCLALFLVVFPVRSFAAPLDVRIIRVGVAVAPAFKTIPNWKSDFERRLGYASRLFESEFKIRFVPVKWFEWPTNLENDETRVLIEDLKAKFPLKDVDIMIGLAHTPKDSGKPVMDPHTIGQARPLSGYLVLRYPVSRLYKIQEDAVLIHEMGHLFGAIHTDDPLTIMSPVVDRQLAARFDSENREIITQTRAIDFRRGIESLPKGVVQRLLGSYLKMVVADQPFDFYYMLGILYMGLGQYQDVVTAWKKAAEKMPNDARIHYNIGMLHLRLGNDQDAVKELMRAIQLFKHKHEDPDKMKALMALGDALMAKKDFQNAYTAYSRALPLDPQNKDLKVNLAILLLKSGQVENAIRELDAVRARDPDNAKVMLNLGIAYFQTGRLHDSERILSEALRKTRNTAESLEIHDNLGKLYYRMKKPEKAVTHFKAVCAVSPNVSCLKGLAQMHYDLKQYDECIRELATVLQIEKTDPDVYGILGTAFMQKGDYENAIPIFREGVRYTTSNAMAARFYRNIGYILVQRKHYDLAEKEFQMAVSKEWNNVENHLGLAMMYVGIKNFAGAQRALEDALRVDPKNKKAKELLDSVKKTMKDLPQMSVQITGEGGT